MKCPKCGNELSDRARFCPKCGMKRPEYSAPAPDRGQETPAPTAPRLEPPQIPPPQKHSKVPILIVIIAVLLVIGCLAAGAILYIVNRPEKAGETSTAWEVKEKDGEQQEYPKKSAAETGRASRETAVAAAQADSDAAVTAPAQVDSDAAVTAPARADSDTAVTAPARADSDAAVTAQAQSAEAEAPAGEDGYILPDSSDRYLTEQDLAGLSPDQLRLARNEIYARHGRKFKDEQLQAYFNSQSWYQGTVEPDRFSDTALLNDVERKNLELIKAREAALN